MSSEQELRQHIAEQEAEQEWHSIARKRFERIKELESALHDALEQRDGGWSRIAALEAELNHCKETARIAGELRNDERRTEMLERAALEAEIRDVHVRNAALSTELDLDRARLAALEAERARLGQRETLLKYEKAAQVDAEQWRERYGKFVREMSANPPPMLLERNQKIAYLESEVKQRDARIAVLKVGIDAERRMRNELAGNVSALFDQFVDISLMTALGGEVDDYTEVTKAVERIVNERDEARKLVRKTLTEVGERLPAPLLSTLQDAEDKWDAERDEELKALQQKEDDGQRTGNPAGPVG